MDPNQRYKSKYTGPQMDVAFERALPGGAIDLSLSNKANVDSALYRRNLTFDQLNACAEYPYMGVTGPSASFGPRPDYWDVEYHYFDATNGVQFITAVISGDRWYRVFNGGVAKDWKQIATSTPPTEYDLPLASGITATEGGCFYSKTQDGIVNLVVSCKKETDGLVSDSIIATLPVDVRPAREAVTNAFAITSDNTTYGCSIRIWPSGEIKIWVPVTNINQVGFQISFVAGN